MRQVSKSVLKKKKKKKFVCVYRDAPLPVRSRAAPVPAGGLNRSQSQRRSEPSTPGPGGAQRPFVPSPTTRPPWRPVGVSRPGAPHPRGARPGTRTAGAGGGRGEDRRSGPREGEGGRRCCCSPEGRGGAR